MAIQKRPFYNDRIFWDVRVNDLDFQKHAPMIIERIFDRGDVEDVRFCRRYYGDQFISDTLVHHGFLSWGRLHLASAILNLPVQSFKCYTSKQLNQGLIPY